MMSSCVMMLLVKTRMPPVDYYMLALSWSPAFCEKQRAQYGNNLPDSAQYQCSTKINLAG